MNFGDFFLREVLLRCRMLKVLIKLEFVTLGHEKIEQINIKLIKLMCVLKDDDQLTKH